MFYIILGAKSTLKITPGTYYFKTLLLNLNPVQIYLTNSKEIKVEHPFANEVEMTQFRQVAFWQSLFKTPEDLILI